MKELQKRILFFIFSLLLTSNALAQEFQTYENGLIYSPSTIKRLNFIADSLNVQYRTCVKKDWKAFRQTLGFNYFVNDSVRMIKVGEALKEGKSRAAVEQILERKKLDTDTVLAIEFNAFDNDSRTYITTIASLGDRNIIDFDIDFPLNKITTVSSEDGGVWIWKIEKEWSGRHTLTIYYLIEPFQSFQIPPLYNDWINYAQCIVDTSAGIFTEKVVTLGRFSEGERCNDSILFSQKEFERRVDSLEHKFSVPTPKEPEWYNGEDKEKRGKYEQEYEAYEKLDEEWTKQRIAFVNKELHKEKDFESLAYKAWKESSENNCFSLTFATDLGRYYNKSLALDLNRSRRIVGICSRDDSPRRHLCEIAMLSAEAGRWDVFMRAHLDMMNDRVSRNSDNSAAQKYRGVYMKELEETPVDLVKLFPGMVFRIDDAPKHHYYNSLVRSAKAIAASKNYEQYKIILFSALSDKKLDCYNRMIFGYVYRNACHYHSNFDDKIMQKELAKIRKALQDLPVFLQNQFVEEE